MCETSQWFLYGSSWFTPHDALSATLPGAVRAHHHPHHECCRETMWLPFRMSHLPVFLHAYTSHPVPKFLFPGRFNVNIQWQNIIDCALRLILPIKYYSSSCLLINSNDGDAQSKK